MAENDNSSSLIGIKNDSILTSSVYSSSKVTEDDALLVASLSLPVEIHYLTILLQARTPSRTRSVIL